MALDTTKLRKRLPPPPADGNPEIDRPEPEAPRGPVRAAPSVPSMPAVQDGRSLRATGRTMQVNLKLRPETKARLIALASSRGQLMAEVIEDALAALEKQGSK